VTDRNAVLQVAEFRVEDECDDMVDWGLMEAQYWSNTPEDPDRRERRMAECLVHGCVPFNLFEGIVVHSDAKASAVRESLAGLGNDTKVLVRADWYF
jgi:hypothetical protein